MSKLRKSITTPTYRVGDMTLAEVFAVGSHHLLKQNRKSLNEENCVYRAPDGAMCGAGPFIPDEEYTSSLEGMSITGSERFLKLFGLRGYTGFSHDARWVMLKRFQAIHDRMEPDQWAAALQATKEAFVLTNVEISEAVFKFNLV